MIDEKFGFRPAFVVSGAEEIDRDGQLVPVGALYVNGYPLRVPLEPVLGQDIPDYIFGSNLEFCPGKTSPKYQIKCFKVGSVLIADRVLLKRLAWIDAPGKPFARSLTKQFKQSVLPRWQRKEVDFMSIPDLIEQRFGKSYLGMEEIPIAGRVDVETEILKAYLGKGPGCPFFGDILVVIRCEERFFELHYHVWRAKQRPADANRLSEIQEFRVGEFQGLKFLERVDTDFGRRAFWLYTPACCLDDDALALRAVARVLKQYSVSHQLCAHFRRKYKTGR